ncbi:MAG: aldehyde ferredoxin oxidoreductase C-terminal domain-containing protein [Bacillota bacterium]|nr:aldehyde ferredoxin oxidoreductase C-terminal domain-containing protein [Bacillota bacterium]
MNNILRIDMKNLSGIWEGVPEAYQLLGGRALTSRLVSEEVKPSCDALGPENKLVIAPGLLGGTTVTCSGRLSIGAKSPLTGGIKESNAGGTTAIQLAQSGIRALVLEGQAANNELYLLVIDGNEVTFKSAEDYKGMGNYPLAARLRQEYGEKAALITIGSAGELGLPTACIANVDMEGRPSRVNGRGGLGAVMGSKGVKAIIVKNADKQTLKGVDEEKFKESSKKIATAIMENPITKVYSDYGTSSLVDVANNLGCLPTKNFSAGNFDQAEKINGEALKSLILERGGKGKTSHACMPGCIIKCSNIVPDQKGEEIVAPLEYETIGLMGSNCGIGSIDKIAELNYIANDIGIDTIEAGAAIGVAMEAGVISWGDADAVIKTLKGINDGNVLGRLLAFGAVMTGKVLGVSRVPAVKGQSIPAYDPRSLKGLGVTYSISPMGADHTAGTTLRAPVDHSKPEGQVVASKNAQINVTVFDMLGLCMFTMATLINHKELIGDTVSSFTGKNVTFEDLQGISRQTLLREIDFNVNAGIIQNDLPGFFRTESLSPKSTVFDVPQEAMEEIYLELKEGN